MRECLALREKANALKLWAERRQYALPGFVARTLGESPDTRRAESSLRPTEGVPFPKDVEPEWFWVPCGSAEVKSVALAVLRAEGRPMTMRALTARILDLRPTSEGTIANVATQLVRDTRILREDGGLEIMPDVTAPMLHEGWLFATPDVLGKYDVAWFRRAVIKKLLAQWPTGLQVGQIVEKLGEQAWLTCPRDKDIVKMDIASMKESKEVKRTGNSGKWVLITQEVTGK